MTATLTCACECRIAPNAIPATIWLLDRVPALATEMPKLVAPTTWEFKLRRGVKFHNGEDFNADAVKFSIERAYRLNVPGSSEPLLASLRRIETPDERTVRFLLSRVDTQFGLALASPAASICSWTRRPAHCPTSSRARPRALQSWPRSAARRPQPPVTGPASCAPVARCGRC